MAADQEGAFRGRHFTAEVILWALRWYLAFPISYRDLAAMLSDRGVVVDHTTYVDGPGAAIRFHLLRPLHWLVWGKFSPRRLCDPVRCALMSGLLRGRCRWPSWVCACVPGTSLSRALEAQRR